MKAFHVCLSTLGMATSLAIPAFATAQESSVGSESNFVEEQPVRDPGHAHAITLSPLHLAVPLFEVTYEYRVVDRFGLAAIFGLGSSEGVLAFETGVQANLYIVGDFDHGMQLGAELVSLSASSNANNVSSTASGLSAGPYLGYKVAGSSGLTFMAQVGYQITSVAAQASSGGFTASDSRSGSGVLLNLNLGWSF
ncbi:hypothetical protein FRC96_04560 [Lujinxingia vulgaris]|uniref:Outer membrane protein beta-barrel domain-containing protein n=1 Tax=Lujinxingia vulgaris TaxID=2600176 RepID=A0A5C6XDN9_9DELT|nr:hypothetical protein [Lujinxingia vulgaris]TXD41263.1 hypothetical protein FRC96_04560 [Lujinxingia vulgaris]